MMGSLRAFSTLLLLVAVSGATMALGCTGTPDPPYTIDFEVSEGTKLAFDVSPDGQTIVFDLLGQLWLLPIEGGRARPLTDAVRDTAEDLDPAFSPDGRWIAFEGNRPDGYGVWVVPTDGGDPRLVTPPADIRIIRPGAAWSPDGREIAYVGLGSDRSQPWTIHRVEVDSGRSTRLALEPLPGGRPSPMGTLAWSPDGTRLAFGTGTDPYNGFLAQSPAGRGARVWEVDAAGGTVTAVTADGVTATAPAYAPDGRRLAYYALDGSGKWQLWIRSAGDGTERQLTDHHDMSIRRARWTPDGTSLVYSADGRLWRVHAESGDIAPIPFTARVSFERNRAEPSPVEFAAPATDQPARGFYGLALSPDGTQIAMLALGRLWVWPPSGSPRDVGPVPEGASHVSWSGDGTEVVFTTGDLFAMNVETARVRRLTALSGLEQLPAWSPDGRHIAFLHNGTTRLIPATAEAVSELALTTQLAGPIPGGLDAPLNERMQPVWAPDSEAVLVYANFLSHTAAVVVSLAGETRPLARFPDGPTFLHWTAADRLVYAHANRLWQAGFDRSSGMLGDPVPLTDDLAAYVSASLDGTALFVSEGGLRRRGPDGGVTDLGWPVTYRTRSAAEPLLLQNVRIIDGTGAAPEGLQDILVEHGRISRIAAAGRLTDVEDAVVLDAAGRTTIPGLIDTHQHLDVAPLLDGLLYHGVTTVRDLGSPLAWTAARRDMVASGASAGSRVIFGHRFARGGGVAESMTQWVSDPAEISRGMGLAEAFGASVVKLYDDDNWPVGAAIIREAERRGLRTTGHCAYLLALVAAGVDGQEHTGDCGREAGAVYEDHIRLKRAAGIWTEVNFTPPALWITLGDDPGLYDLPGIAPFFGPWQSNFPAQAAPRRRPAAEAGVGRRAETTARLHRAGAVIIAGTDHRFPAGMHMELVALTEAGLSPLEAIAAATSTAARAVGAAADLGTVEVGKLADLVLLDADPLEDIRHISRIWQVIQGGHVIDRQALLDRGRQTNRPGLFWLGY